MSTKIKLIELSDRDAYYDVRHYLVDQVFDLITITESWDDGWTALQITIPEHIKNYIGNAKYIEIFECKFEYV
jgi:hypothetical protein